MDEKLLNTIHCEYLDGMIEASSKINVFVENMNFEEFQEDYKTNYAVIRGLEIIGAGAKRLPSDIKDNYPDIPWQKLSHLRDDLIKAYIKVNPKLIWEVVKEDMPELYRKFMVVREKITT